MGIQLGMIVLYARDLQKSIEFYRLLGLDVPDPHPQRPVSINKLDNGVTMIITVDEVALRFDSQWTRPEGGYQQVVEFFVDDDAAVDAVWNTLTSAGYSGRTAPGRLLGPYATMIEDPDGNVVLITNEPRTNADAPAPA
ncbi:VOC family protein [Kribbella sp. DT2]|uniref:VOC family protein n=1 Tax=Kribbella sp. DT2 TaxID=3393427 RepID=UPI003CF4B510